LNTWKAAAALGLLAGTIAAGALPVQAQGASFPDVPANHWAYQAVQDLADKGYVKGYPDGKLLGKRALTRYEFATVIDRIAQTVSDLSTQFKAGQPMATPTGIPATQDDLNKVNALVDSFKAQLQSIQSLTAGATSPFQGQIDALRSDLADAQANTAKAQKSADAAYGFGDRKFSIGGYIQTRFVGGPNSHNLYPEGSNTVSGAYNGSYAQGGNNDSFEVRRARIMFKGNPTPNTSYSAQLDFSGAVSTSNQQVTVRDANGTYTFGDGSPAKNLSITAGQLFNFFGYQLPLSSSAILTPERPLAFNETGFGLWANDDYDKGVKVTAPLQGIASIPITLYAAAVNGDRASESVDRRIDGIYRAAYQSPNKALGVGLSYYGGHLRGSGVGPAYVSRDKDLLGLDAQYISPAGPFLLGEYLSGKYEQIQAFGEAKDAATNPTGLGTVYAPGNKVEGYYIQVGFTFGKKTARPLTLFASYDVLKRNKDNSAYDDANIGGGVMCNLDSATRLRLYYVKPSKVAHMPGAPDPAKVGLTTAEVQFKF